MPTLEEFKDGLEKAKRLKEKEAAREKALHKQLVGFLQGRETDRHWQYKRRQHTSRGGRW